jgi:SAM-dependent methyltransferase
MDAPIPFDPNRFHSAAPHYFARPSYAPRLIARVVTEVGLTSSDRVMDLGCGPGLLAIAFAPFAKEVVGIDPNAAMLAAGKAAAADHSRKIHFMQGSSNDLDDRFGRFRLVMMGRSFHWMDRTDTLRRLNGIIEPGGAVAVFDVDTISEGAGHWHVRFCEIVERYAVGKAEWRSPDWVHHEAFLLESAFRQLDGFSVVERTTFPATQLVDLAFSMSRTSPQALGQDKAAALAADLKALAAEVAVDGMVSEIRKSNVLLARRP